MDYFLLKATFFNLAERLDKYFDDKLMQEPRAKADLENHKNDLLQDLAVELWANYNRETYKSYSHKAFIWLKAEKVWISFARKLKRQTRHKSNICIDNLHESYVSTSFLPQLESRNALAIIEDLLSHSEIQLLEYRAQGFTYKQIKDLTYYPSEKAAKTKFNRLKKFIHRHFRRP